MIDKDKLFARWQHFYDTAIEDGHREKSREIAWEWTWEAIEGEFARIKGQHEATHEEAINQAFYP